MANKSKQDNTSISDIANVLLDPATNSANQPSALMNALNDSAHYNGMGNGYQTEENKKSSRHKENLPFQEWTAKYHQ